MKFDKVIKLLKEYGIYTFDGRYSNFNDKYTTDEIVLPTHNVTDYSKEKEYSMHIYHEWAAFNFILFINIINASLLKKPNKIPLIKTLRMMFQPFSFGLKEAKEFVERLKNLNIIIDTNDNIEFASRKYEIGPKGERLLNKLNIFLPDNFDNTLTRIFAKVLLLDTKLLTQSLMIDKMIKEYFSFENMYNEEKEELELELGV